MKGKVCHIQPIAAVSLGEGPGQTGLCVVHREERQLGKPYGFAKERFDRYGRQVKGRAAERDDLVTRVDLETLYSVKHLERPEGSLSDVLRRLLVILANLEGDERPVGAIDLRATGYPAFREFWRMADDADLGVVLMPAVVSNAMGNSGGKNSEGAFVIPRANLITAGHLAFSTARLRVAPLLRLASTLRTELNEFTRKPMPANIDDPWRLSTNDDLVLATTLAVYAGEMMPRRKHREIDPWEGTPLADGTGG